MHNPVAGENRTCRPEVVVECVQSAWKSLRVRLTEWGVHFVVPRKPLLQALLGPPFKVWTILCFLLQFGLVPEDRRCKFLRKCADVMIESRRRVVPLIEQQQRENIKIILETPFGVLFFNQLTNRRFRMNPHNKFERHCYHHLVLRNRLGRTQTSSGANVVFHRTWTFVLSCCSLIQESKFPECDLGSAPPSFDHPVHQPLIAIARRSPPCHVV
mmetsp:Transcript_63505/g.150469  ORF Transcript_63505/g.150469 Transcript_63505/m.150469 type:complete len:214 (+) Transcript_63505:204-845(+)